MSDKVGFCLKCTLGQLKSQTRSQARAVGSTAWKRRKVDLEVTQAGPSARWLSDASPQAVLRTPHGTSAHDEHRGRSCLHVTPTSHQL